MGAFASVDLRPEEISEIEAITSFEPQEIKSLYKRFRRLDRGHRGTISVEDLQMIPEVSMNPLAQRLTALFERDVQDRINFKSFVTGLSVFSEHARPDVRQRAVFRLYDLDADGAISEADLTRVLAMMVGKSMPPEDMAAVVRQTLAECDRDGDGAIGYEDFQASLDMVAWGSFTVPVKSSSRWEARQGDGPGGASQLSSSASHVRLADAGGAGTAAAAAAASH